MKTRREDPRITDLRGVGLFRGRDDREPRASAPCTALRQTHRIAAGRLHAAEV